MADNPSVAGAAIQPLTPICAIGASAGGVTALQTLFRLLRPDLGLAYVVIVHLAPDHPSAMGQILGACTRMPVLQVDDGPTLKADCVYVIAPDRELVIDGDHVTSRDFTEPRGKRAPIDMFFRSVAAARGDGIGMILTGAGSDGAAGVRAIKEAGGVIMVQEPAEAAFPMMPQNAIATGAADFIGTLARLADLIGEVAHSKEAVRSLDADGAANDLRRIIGFLRTRTGHDFSSYKRATVLRRVARRMQVTRTDSLTAYADLLRTEPEEAKELFADLLISVTMFFRDAQAFGALGQQAIGPLFDRASEDDGLRLWVVGCATGEEAYSVAMLLLEEMNRRKVLIPIQIFATDLDEGALATAREGRYPRSIEADVTEERLQRFFVDEGTHFRIRKEVRDLLLFAHHSVLKDPPFTRLDLVTCRNLLIYLERSLQQQLCAVFHYGLRPDGYLFLGSAETADGVTDLFAAVDRDARLYQTRPTMLQPPPLLPQLPAIERLSVPAAATTTLAVTPPNTAIHAAALERLAPPSALVDEGHAILNMSDTAGRFILHSSGPLSSSLPAIVRPELRLDLKLALGRAFGGLPTLTHPIAVRFEGEARRVALHVQPVVRNDRTAPRALVFFLDNGPVPENDGLPAEQARPDEMQRLHGELKGAQEALIVSRHDHEVSVQDLRAANEELQSINEEYRSTAEELETSKEELQSINEELQTVNAELKIKLDGISVAHGDLQNITASTEIGTLFLDTELRIRLFTPPIADLINITDHDIGRLVTDFTHRLEIDGIEADVRRVLRTLTPLDREVPSKDGRWYVMRLRPYRTVEDRIDGTVISFIDVTARHEAEAALSESEHRYRMLIEGVPQLVWTSLDGGHWTWSSSQWQAYSGLTERQSRGLGWLRAIHPDDRDMVMATWRGAKDKGVFEAECRIGHVANQNYRWFQTRAMPVLDNGGQTLEWLGSSTDVDDLRRLQEKQAVMVAELQHRTRNLIAVVRSIAQQTADAAGDLPTFRDKFNDRLAALTRVQELLSRSDQEPITIETLVRSELDALGSASTQERVEVAGPDLALRNRDVQIFALAIHELATNARKYGAFSTPDGRLSVTWRAYEDAVEGPRLRLEWLEDGVEPTVGPQADGAGYGRELIERALPYSMGARTSYTIEDRTVRCSIDIPNGRLA